MFWKSQFCVCSTNLEDAGAVKCATLYKRIMLLQVGISNVVAFFARRFIGGTEFERSERPYCHLTNQHMESTVSSWSKNIGAFFAFSNGVIFDTRLQPNLVRKRLAF